LGVSGERSRRVYVSRVITAVSGGRLLGVRSQALRRPRTTSTTSRPPGCRAVLRRTPLPARSTARTVGRRAMRSPARPPSAGGISR
jgi:hypothetical protein